jgi:iron complex outermembrane receptor protein
LHAARAKIALETVVFGSEPEMIVYRRPLVLIGIVICLFVTTSHAFGQSDAQPATATLSGVVVDQTGAAISDVDVVVVHPTTGLQRSVRTDAEGAFVIPRLTPGRYTVRAQREGFATAQANDVELEADNVTPIRMRLDVASLGESVVVTAQRLAQRQQDVPISMSVLRGQELDSSTAEGITDALRGVPGVAPNIAVFGGSSNVSIRGAAAAGPAFFGSGPVSYYIDTVPFGLVRSALLPDANAYDLERVEVLRGPQGTLYGANAQNGVVRILTKDPDLSAFDFKLRSSLSTTAYGGESARVDSAVNLPLIKDKLAVRATLGSENLGGWIDRPDEVDANDSKRLNIRAKLNARPTKRLSIGLQTWVSRIKNGAPNYSPDNRQMPFADNEQSEQRFNLYGAKVGYDLGGYTVQSSTSFIDYGNDFSFWVPPSTLLNTFLGSDVFTQEVNVASHGAGPWRWTSGAVYRDAEDLLQQRTTPTIPGGTRDRSQSYAVFGDVTRRLVRALEVSVGLRYFNDRVTQTERGDPADTSIVTYRKGSEFDKVSPKIALTWLPNLNFTAYTTYSEGFRSGFNQSSGVARVAPNFPPLRPDNLKNYEVGAKGILLERLQFDLALYYIKWLDVQQPLTVPDLDNPTSVTNYVAVNINGVSASGPGIDFGATWEPKPGLTFGTSLGWNDLTQDEDVVAFTSAAPNGVVIFPKGSRLNLSPETTVSGSTGYAFDIGHGGYRMRMSASLSYVASQFYNRLVGAAVDVTPGQSLMIGRISAAIDSPEHWSATFFVDNLNNEQNSVFLHWTGVAERNLRARPRTVGVQFEYGF